LTLYTIEQEKKIEVLNSKNIVFKKQNTSLESRLSKIEKLLIK